MRHITIAAVLIGLVVLAGAAETTRMSVVRDGPTILRQTPQGEQRMLIVSIENPGGGEVVGLELRMKVGAAAIRRELLPIRGAEVWDTVWLPAGVTGLVGAELRKGADVIWAGALRVPPVTPDAVTIPVSPPVKLSDLKPLMLRGTNYYPRRTPWPGLWREATEQEFEAEFSIMDSLHINTFRTFYNMDEEAKLTRRDGAMTPVVIARINKLLEVAARHRLKVMLCLGGGPHMGEIDTWQRFYRFGVEPFQYDGRILMWDLINEPGGGDGPKATPELAHWIQAMYPYLEKLAPNHIVHTGVAWQFDQLWDLGIKPPVAHYHHYSGTVGVQPEGKPPVRNVADDVVGISKFVGNRPLIIGEFGYATVVDNIRKDASEARQLAIYEGVLSGVEAAVKRGVNLVGVYNWCELDFIPDWMGKGEQSFGVVRVDGSLKPAGKLLQETYARWAGNVKAEWEK